MKIVFHKGLTNDRWDRFTFDEQMANVGSEVFRAIKWKRKGDLRGGELAFERALELFYLTLQSQKDLSKKEEVACARERFIDFYKLGNKYKTTALSLNGYFYHYNYLARKGT